MTVLRLASEAFAEGLDGFTPPWVSVSCSPCCHPACAVQLTFSLGEKTPGGVIVPLVRSRSVATRLTAEKSNANDMITSV